jgi:hypothetical protein
MNTEDLKRIASRDEFERFYCHKVDSAADFQCYEDDCVYSGWAAWEHLTSMMVAALEAAETNNIRPNVMRCAKCSLRVTGAVSKAQCPNGCGPLWGVTWKDECQAAEAREAELLAEIDTPLKYKANYLIERNSLHELSQLQAAEIERLRGMVTVEKVEAFVIVEMMQKALQHSPGYYFPISKQILEKLKAVALPPETPADPVAEPLPEAPHD